MNSFDEAIGRSFAWLAQNDGAFFGPFFRGISFLGDYGIGFLLALAILAVFKKTRRSALIAFLAIALGFIVSNLLLKNMVARPRPFSDQTSPFYEWWVAAGSLGESGYSFPSGHTTLAASFAFSLFFFYPKRFSWAFLFLPILMGASRLYFVVHYGTDVVGGIAVGLLASLIAYFSVKRLCRFQKMKALFPE